MEFVFSLDHFSAIAADLHYILLLGQPLPEFLYTAWHISSQPAPSVPLILGQRILLVSCKWLLALITDSHTLNEHDLCYIEGR